MRERIFEIQFIPETGKKVWFESTCNAFYDGFTAIEKDHIIEGIFYEHLTDSVLLSERAIE